MGQSHEAELGHQSLAGIASPHGIPPPFGEEGIETPLNPAVQAMEEATHVGFTIKRPPAANHGSDPVDHFPQFEGRFAPGKAPELSPELLDALLAWDSRQVTGMSGARALV